MGGGEGGAGSKDGGTTAVRPRSSKPLLRQLPWELSWSCFHSAEDVRVEADGRSDVQMLWSGLSCFVLLKEIDCCVSLSIMLVLESYLEHIKLMDP